MGSSISGVIAEITLQAIEKEIFERTPTEIKEWKRYVDDVIAIIPQEQIENTLNFINSIHPDIQFACEMENERKLPYLDLEIIRSENQGIKLKIHRKPTSKNILLNAKSNNPKHHKLAVIRSQVDRAFNLCSPEFLDEELNIVRNNLIENGYANKDINRAIRHRRIRNNNANNHSNNQLSIKYISAPYIQGPSEIINRTLKKHNIILTCKPSRTIKNQLPQVKDPIPINETPNVVYKIPCNNCDEFYIGETGRSLETRKKEHQGSIQRRDNNSQVYQHVSQLPNPHSLQWNNASIIHRNGNMKQRRVIEAAYTISNNKTYNRCTDLPPTLVPLVKNICNSIKY